MGEIGEEGNKEEQLIRKMGEGGSKEEQQIKIRNGGGGGQPLFFCVCFLGASSYCILSIVFSFCCCFNSIFGSSFCLSFV